MYQLSQLNQSSLLHQLIDVDTTYCQTNKDRIDTEVNSAKTDYAVRETLKDNAQFKLQVLKSTMFSENMIKTTDIQEYKILTDDAILREKNFRSGGDRYKSVLIAYTQCYFSIQSEIDRINQNTTKSINDQTTITSDYQFAEDLYNRQQQAWDVMIQNETIIQQANVLKSDFIQKVKLKNDGKAKFDLLYQTYIGKIISATDLNNLKSVLDDVIQKEQILRNSANIYKNYLTQNSSVFGAEPPDLVEINKDINVSTNDQSTEIENYQAIEKQYLLQEQYKSGLTKIGIGTIGLGILAVATIRYVKKSKQQAKKLKALASHQSIHVDLRRD